jgi:nitrile hydratase accessory protein
MARSTNAVIDVDGPAAPPRRNGELVFQAPWESRLFGVTISLNRAGIFAWDEFRSLLIDEIGTWERQGQAQADWSYYARWAAALERLLASKGIFGGEDLARRVHELELRPAGHDH